MRQRYWRISMIYSKVELASPGHFSMMIGAWLNSRFARYPKAKLVEPTKKIIATNNISFS